MSMSWGRGWRCCCWRQWLVVALNGLAKARKKGCVTCMTVGGTIVKASQSDVQESSSVWCERVCAGGECVHVQHNTGVCGRKSHVELRWCHLVACHHHTLGALRTGLAFRHSTTPVKACATHMHTNPRAHTRPHTLLESPTTTNSLNKSCSLLSTHSHTTTNFLTNHTTKHSQQQQQQDE